MFETIATLPKLLIVSILLVSILAIIFSILKLRVKHPNNIYTILYVYFFTATASSLASLYIHGIYEIGMLTTDDKSIQYQITNMFIQISSDFIGEFLLIGSFLSLVIIPQILCFFVGGIFGCGSPPRYVSTSTKLSIVGLVKFFSILAGIRIGQCTYFLLIGIYGEINTFISLIIDSIFLLACSFLILISYLKWSDAYNLINLKYPVCLAKAF